MLSSWNKGIIIIIIIIIIKRQDLDGLQFRICRNVIKILLPLINDLRLNEPLNYFETHFWRFRQTYFFEKN